MMYHTNVSTAGRTPIPPQTGAMLRWAWDAWVEELMARVAAAGFDDLRAVHRPILRDLLFDGQRPGHLAARLGLSKQAVNDILRVRGQGLHHPRARPRRRPRQTHRPHRPRLGIRPDRGAAQPRDQPPVGRRSRTRALRNLRGRPARHSDQGPRPPRPAGKPVPGRAARPPGSQSPGNPSHLTVPDQVPHRSTRPASPYRLGKRASFSKRSTDP